MFPGGSPCVTEAQAREKRLYLDSGKTFLPQMDKILGHILKTDSVFPW